MKKIIIETKQLKEMLESVKNAASKEEFRPIFKGVLLEATNTKLSMTTCDGYKLFTNTCELIEGSSFTVISPMFSIPKGAEENTEIKINKEFIIFNFGNVKYSYKTITGDFIDYRNLLNRESNFSIRFNSKLLLEALRTSKGIVEMYFAGDREAVIIKEIENENSQKLVLPCSKGREE